MTETVIRTIVYFGVNLQGVIDMPSALLFKLICQKDDVVYGFTGQHVSDTFRSIWGELLEETSSTSARGTNLSMWTVSPLMGVAEMRHRRTPLLVGDISHIRFTLLDDRTLPELEESLQREIGSTITIGGVPWQLSEILGTESGDPRTGYESFESLSRKYSTYYAELPEVWKLSLSTPTVVRTVDGEYLPFPLPQQVLLNWLQSWATFAPSPSLFDAANVESLSREIAGNLAVFRYNLKSIGTSFAFGSDQLPEAGCTGKISLRSIGLSRTERQIVATLVDYSSYSGTGMYTDLGLGQTSSV